MDGSVYNFYLLISSERTCWSNLVFCFVLDGYSLGLAENVAQLFPVLFVHYRYTYIVRWCKIPFEAYFCFEKHLQWWCTPYMTTYTVALE